MTDTNYKIAYFSAEIGISASLPTYGGGLGVLAGDHIKAAADANLPMCAVTLLYKEGYFRQRVDRDGNQTESYPRFDPDPLLKKLSVKFTLPLRGRNVWINAWKYSHMGLNGHTVPIFLLDTDVDENLPEDREITLRLYSGDKDHRILQEAILGFGGIKLLEMLGINDIEIYHMNEGHSALITLELFRKFKGNREELQKRCHFTTHTPVPAGHDHFSMDRLRGLLDSLIPDNLELPSIINSNRFHMTELGLYFSRSANGVSQLHGIVAQSQFPDFNIGHINNGVYHPYWAGKVFRELFDTYFPGWREDPELLLNIEEIPDDKFLYAHLSQKEFILDYSNSLTQRALSPDILTIGFARRTASYKRASLIFNKLDRLVDIGHGKIQIIFAGKAHPHDEDGKDIIREIVGYSHKLFGKIKVVYLENYNMWLGRLLTSGVDVWLNTPLRPQEASGTSGMKAALNGAPNLSILDGWWAEACHPGENGWGIGDPDNPNNESDADSLYDILEKEVIPVFYNDRKRWSSLMRKSIKTGVKFTAHRMIHEYATQYYHLKI
ncbi:MAG: alpha-glucan family phosphorylase [Candidatus Marinimicrobia bacterium]|nr:alpha-glucan family phosphorylase [Candidatus Neomarinimicrobiota bacterium]MBL7047070.1 alpha-glucan family phosphorylase [Candidatus Neomarinimicrobiota bacterium]